eukprot:CAMPEP_0196579616 /NCGR_PEP_ID=MMETSP1081-20130531/23562_1 /TAXON_ID=36882 /ORGANISM="Pyramimonas amylifera, Strain CCMP720" /LENGTH=83 /DNA_ID=CAMNT_0041899251 /DNA_START=180 /DNA_END=431 /DNA_ORIENTATION=-
MSRSRGLNNAILAGGLALFGTSAFVFPVFLSDNRPEFMKSDYSQNLDKQRQVRGPYVNTGSRDVGPDLNSIQAHKDVLHENLK